MFLSYKTTVSSGVATLTCSPVSEGTMSLLALRTGYHGRADQIKKII